MAYDPYNLARFIEAQAETHALALAELRAGTNDAHWMMYIFPQLDRPGIPSAAQRYAIKNLDEARAFWKHPVLGLRLRACMNAVLSHPGHSVTDILGSPDDLKLRSCATLFALASKDRLFTDVLKRFYDGVPDPKTARQLGW